MVAEAEDDSESEPTPLPRHAPPGVSAVGIPSIEITGFTGLGVGGTQTIDDPPSMPTSPFLVQRLQNLDPSGEPGEPSVDEPPARAPFDAAAAATAVRAALERGAAGEAFEASERLVSELGGFEAVDVQAQRELLERVYLAVVGDLRGVPRFAQTTPNLDSRSAFLLSRLDGSSSADDLLDVSGMPRIEALRHLARLVHAGVVRMTPTAT
jgi:hypothetical protein